MSITTRATRRRWQHAGFECATIDSRIGFINGYVRLPATHVAHGATYDQINRTVSVHGGLTYGADADGWVGFDTGHSGDHWPGMSRYQVGPPDRIWSIELLEAEVERLAERLADLTAIAIPESSWDCTDAEFRTLLRQAKAWRRIKATR